jgi:hypothetical protein
VTAGNARRIPDKLKIESPEFPPPGLKPATDGNAPLPPNGIGVDAGTKTGGDFRPWSPGPTPGQITAGGAAGAAGAREIDTPAPLRAQSADSQTKSGESQGILGETSKGTTEYSPALKDSPYHPQKVQTRNTQIYESNPKHKAEKIGNISAEPLNGQLALDNSIRFKLESSRRIGVDPVNKQFVVFDEHLNGKYHGHVRNWNELRPEMQNALIEAGFTDNKGNILSVGPK